MAEFPLGEESCHVTHSFTGQFIDHLLHGSTMLGTLLEMNLEKQEIVRQMHYEIEQTGCT